MGVWIAAAITITDRRIDIAVPSMVAGGVHFGGISPSVLVRVGPVEGVWSRQVKATLSHALPLCTDVPFWVIGLSLKPMRGLGLLVGIQVHTRLWMGVVGVGLSMPMVVVMHRWVTPA